MSQFRNSLHPKQFMRPVSTKPIAALLMIFTAWSAAVAQDGGSLQARGEHAERSLNNWVAAWQGSPTVGGTFSTSSCPSDVGVNNQTVRNIVFISAGGDHLRVRISNVGGSVPLRVGSASVAVSAGGADTVPGTLHSLRFAGQTSTVIAAEGEALSDAVSLKVKSLESLAVSVYLPGATGPATQHYFATQNNYLAAGDESTAAGGSSFSQMIACWMFLSGVDVAASRQVKGTLVTLGDSITDGFASTTGANLRYPDQLARRLAARSGDTLSVSNAGLGGDDLLANREGQPLFGVPAPARLPRDVLTQYGARAVILLEGINDIGANSAMAADLIQIDQQIITQLHAWGLKVYGGTLVPFGGAFPIYGANYGTTGGEQQRQILNRWIRTGGAFDGVIDFDKAIRDPQNPSQMLPVYDSGDHLHPGDAGYLAMANAVDLNVIVKESLERRDE